MYSAPAGTTPQSPNTTIESADWNTLVADLVADANAVRPITAGGTGQNSAVLARGSTGLATAGNIGAKGTDIASAAALALLANFNYFQVTGVVTITSISTRPAGERIVLKFEGALILTHNATSLILPGGVNKPTAAGDVAEFISEGSGNWRCVQYTNASGRGAASFFQIKSTPGAFVYTPTAGARFADFEAVAGGGAGGNVDGQGANTGGAGGGGASGFYGRTGPIDITGAATFNGTIGAAGAVSGAASGDGGNGGNTTIIVGATTYTWGGGTGGGGMVAGGTEGGSQDGGAPGVGTNLVGFSVPGGIGVYNGNTGTNGTGGNGGSSPFGSGGKGPHVITSTGTNGGAAAGFGAGGAGAVVISNSSNLVGSAGTAGYMRVWEYY